jgi:hypothetical protein
MFAEDASQLHPSDDSPEQWQGADVIGTEFEAIGLGTFTRERFPSGAAWRGGRTIGEGLGFGHVGSPQDAGGNRRMSDQGTKRDVGSSRWENL